MTPHLFSLVLTSGTAWAMLAIGYLPVSILRQHRREPLVAVGAWALVSITAPSAIFHWYLILALICLVAWTRLDRPMGKVWLAVAGGLGLSLGLIFPIELLPGSMARANPLTLASLYLGGAVTGLAYAISAVANSAPEGASRASGFARALVIVTIAWAALLGEMVRLNHDTRLRPLAFPGEDAAHTRLNVDVWAPLIPAVILIFLAALALVAARRNAPGEVRWFGAVAAAIAFATSLLAQLVFR